VRPLALSMESACIRSHFCSGMFKCSPHVSAAVSARGNLSIGARLCSSYSVRPLPLSMESARFRSHFCSGIFNCSLHVSAAVSARGNPNVSISARLYSSYCVRPLALSMEIACICRHFCSGAQPSLESLSVLLREAQQQSPAQPGILKRFLK
jgi:hypothetical protein